jgi:hypothetical protein
MKWKYRTASVEARMDGGGVALYRLSGVMTKGDLGAILKDADDWQAQLEPLAVVRDLRDALQGVSLQRYVEMTRELAQPQSGLSIPAWIVPPKSQESFFRAFAASLRGVGVPRQVSANVRDATAAAKREAMFRLRAGFARAPTCTHRTLPPGDPLAPSHT